MSDLMFYGVLRMPYEMAMGSELSRLQFHGRVQEALGRLERAENLVEEAYRAGFMEACRWPEPVTQDADSKALGDRMREWIDKQPKVTP